MKTNRKILMICLIAILLIGGAFLYYYYNPQHITVTLNQEIGKEITGALNRPDCGWYQLYPYYLRPNTPLSADELYLSETDESNYTYRLSLLEFNLAEYKSSELDSYALENISRVFERFSETKSSVIVRFLYDWDGLGMEKEPDDISLIQKHMLQTSTVLNQYSDIIYTTQGIFVGSWAEMHDSKYLSDEDITKLIVYYASVTSPSIYLAVRTPNHYRTIFRELAQNTPQYESYGITASDLRARLGLYNDGMLGSVSDTGTYQRNNDMDAPESEEALRENELSFQHELCARVPNGGEVVNANPYNNWENAIKDMTAMHVSYLNRMYDETVINKWKNSTYRQTGSIYDGRSAYDYITDHLGARFVLRDCDLSYTPFRNNPAMGSVTIENVGFSGLYHPKLFTLSLINEETGESFPLLNSDSKEAPANPCLWASQESVSINFTFSPFDLEDGNYILAASLKEPKNGEVISFANEGYQESLEGYRLGTVTIKR